MPFARPAQHAYHRLNTILGQYWEQGMTWDLAAILLLFIMGNEQQLLCPHRHAFGPAAQANCRAYTVGAFGDQGKTTAAPNHKGLRLSSTK